MKKSKLLLSVVAVLCAIALTSCSIPSVKSNELSLGYSRSLSGTPSASEVKQSVSTELTDVTLRLLQSSVAADERGKNTVISPLSAVLCLGLMANGSAGQTRTQIEQALGMTVSQLNRCLLGYTSSLETDNVKLALANSLWIDGALAGDVKSDFLQANADYYAAQVYETPMDDSTVRDINNWVKDNTDGLIDRIFDELPKSARMVLINTLLFDAKWAQPYEKSDITSGKFTSYNGSVATLDLLCSTETYLRADGVQGFVRPYVGEALCLCRAAARRGDGRL